MTIDPVTGVHTKVSNLPGVNFILLGSSAYDSNANRFIFVGVDFGGINRLYCVDAVTGSILSNPIIAGGLPNELQFDHTTNILYGKISASIYSIEIGTAVTTFVATLPYTSTNIGSTFLDEAASEYRIQYFDTIYTTDVVSGTVTTDYISTNYQAYEYDNLTNQLYALRFLAVNNLVDIDPVALTSSLITVMPNLGVSFSARATFCEFNENYTYANSDTLYTIDVITGNIISDPNFPVGLQPIENVVELKYDNSNGTLFALHWGFGATVDDDTICIGQQAALIAEDFDASVQWSEVANPSVVIGSGDTLLVSPTVTTDYYAFTNADTVLVTVVVVGNPQVVDLGNDTIICQGNVLLDPGPGFTSYLWQDSSSAQTFSADSAGTYWVTVSNGGCSATDSLIIYTDEPVAQFAVQDTLGCAPFDVTFTDQSLAGNSFISSWLWNFGDGNTGTQANPVHNYLQTGIYTTTLTVQTSAGCIDSISETITVDFLLNLPQDFLGADTLLCAGDSINLTVPAINGSFLWSDNSTGQSTAASSPGVYWVNITDAGCSVTDSIIVTNDSISALFSVQNTSCFPYDIGFTDQSVSTQSTIVSWLWDFGDGNTSTQANPVHNYAQSGSYTVSLTVENTNGCFSTVSELIVVVRDEVVADFTTQNGNCVLLNAGFIDMSTSSESSITSWLWDFGDGSSSVQANPLHSFVQNGAFTVSLTVESANGCVDTFTKEINVSNVLPAFKIENTTDCYPFDTRYINETDLNQSTLVNWLWNFGDNTTSNIENPSHSYSESGLYTVSLQVETSLGCIFIDSSQVNITIIPTPVANFTFEPIKPELGQEVVFIDQSVNAIDWTWDFDGNTTSSDQNPTHTFLNEGNYSVNLTVQNGQCSDSQRAFITVAEEIVFYVPNAFTPDGNGVNQIFQPIFTAGFDPYDFQMSIYNRWGEIIFQSYDAQEGWDGQYGGSLIAPGVYVYKITFGRLDADKRTTVNGYVTVLY